MRQRFGSSLFARMRNTKRNIIRPAAGSIEAVKFLMEKMGY